eukprot:TRINITY_DN14323_c0_g1_i2.p1 TRINITY_DN14323_c0_g1~~TRINITY_DN14323_c0_g1_i2.p1  ORF type:complete len:739 (+),score=79.25 TRINITY_DN14323_c0_g1_i2:145-2217(+)
MDGSPLKRPSRHARAVLEARKASRAAASAPMQAAEVVAAASAPTSTAPARIGRPTLLPEGGTYDGQVAISVALDRGIAGFCGQLKYSVETISSATDVSIICPAMHGQLYRKAFVLDTPGMYRVKALLVTDDWGLETSEVATSIYTVRLLPPLFSLASGTYDGTVEVEMKNQSVGRQALDIRYTARRNAEDADNAPTRESDRYNEPLELNEPGRYVVRAACFNARGMSCVTSATYDVRPKPPKFVSPGGQHTDKVSVVLEKRRQDEQLRVMIQPAGDAAMIPDANSLLYEGPLLIEEPGQYVIRAACFSGPVMSDVVFQSVEVVAPSFGKRLKALPAAMVQGVMRFKGVTQAALAPRLESVRVAIAKAAGALVSQVSVDVHEPTGENSKGVEVGFTLEAERMEDAQSFAGKLTQPSLVETVAKLTKAKADSIQIERPQVRALEEVMLSLGWTNPEGNKDFLDGSCLVYSEDALIEVVDYRGPASEKSGHCRCSSANFSWGAGTGPDASISHSGDVLTSTGGSHVVRLRLDRLPPNATDCFFVLSAYNCRDLSKFRDPNMKIFDAHSPSHMLTNYSVSEAGSNAAVVVCSLTRECKGWTVRAFGKSCDGTVIDYLPIEAAIRPFQDRHLCWRRRRDLVLLQALWQADRALPRAPLAGLPAGPAAEAGEAFEDFLVPLLELPVQLFRHVVQFL